MNQLHHQHIKTICAACGLIDQCKMAPTEEKKKRDRQIVSDEKDCEKDNFSGFSVEEENEVSKK